MVVVFFFKQKTAYEIGVRLVGSEMCIRDRYTTLFSYILMALFQGIWARKLCKENGIAGSSVFEDRKLILLACVTTVLCLFGIALYNFYLIRYLVIVLMAVLSIVLYKKYKTAKKN